MLQGIRLTIFNNNITMLLLKNGRLVNVNITMRLPLERSVGSIVSNWNRTEWWKWCHGTEKVRESRRREREGMAKRRALVGMTTR